MRNYIVNQLYDEVPDMNSSILQYLLQDRPRTKWMLDSIRIQRCRMVFTSFVAEFMQLVEDDATLAPIEEIDCQ